MSRVFNFSSGPAMLPESVLQQAQGDLLDWHGTGMSIMEMSHRGNDFVGVADEAEADLRQLMDIPTNYKVLFLQGGASSQFAMVPMNLLRNKTRADYANTGQWSKKAIAEARKYGDVNVVASSEDAGFTTIPDFSHWQCDPRAAYLHYTPNETIGGLEYHWIPESGDVPLVADMSSNILSRPIDVSKFGLIYAGAQKNIGPAGITVVIVRDDLIGQVAAHTPTMFDYKVHADSASMYNTPPTFGLYLAGLVFKWLKKHGGVERMARINQRKAEKLYAAIDSSPFYHNPIDPTCRSWMNIPFTLARPELDAAFSSEARENGLVSLEGHRSVGGMRASIYNAMPLAGVQALVDYMREFEQKHA